MKHILKIDLKFWNLIEEGIKEWEVRKVEKEYIEGGDIVYFISLDEKTLYGKRKVGRHENMTYESIVNNLTIDEETIKFVKDHYYTEQELYVFKLLECDSE